MKTQVAFCSQFRRDKLLQATRFIDIHVSSAQKVRDNWAVKVGLIVISFTFDVWEVLLLTSLSVSCP